MKRFGQPVEKAIIPETESNEEESSSDNEPTQGDAGSELHSAADGGDGQEGPSLIQSFASDILEENAELLRQLEQFQQERMLTKQPWVISDDEQETGEFCIRGWELLGIVLPLRCRLCAANQLVENIVELSRGLPPSMLVDSKSMYYRWMGIYAVIFELTSDFSL